MSIRIPKIYSEFRNPLILFADTKSIDIERTLVNLYMLLHWDGAKARFRVGKRLVEVADMVRHLQDLEEKGKIIAGAREYPKAVEWWIRNNLVNLVHRGKPDKEKVTSLKPIHLGSYLIRNAKYTRDYNSSEQVYSMLNVAPQVRQALKEFLMEGWDQNLQKVDAGPDMDVDTLGLLRLIEGGAKVASDATDIFSQIQPILPGQAKLFCDDLQRLLVYREVIPRHVLIDYIEVLISFHLGLYVMKVIRYLPDMVKAGRKDIETPLSFVVDLTDQPDSKISKIARQDAKEVMDSIMTYIRATFQINQVLGFLELDQTDSKNLDQALALCPEPPEKLHYYCEQSIRLIMKGLKEEDADYLNSVQEFEESYLDKYLALTLGARGKYLFRYVRVLLDAICLKNSEKGFLAQGRSRKHQRKFVLGTRLLETLVQIHVLQHSGSTFYSQPIPIDTFLTTLREQYGLIINGIGEPRFQDADIHTHLAFQENMTALKNKLRRIGFYSDLSDAFLMQKIRPRYSITPKP